MAANTYIKANDFNYIRMTEIMHALMCWNWDFSMDTFKGVLKIKGFDSVEFIANVEYWQRDDPRFLEGFVFHKTTEKNTLIFEIN